MLFELPHFAVELLVVLPCVQVRLHVWYIYVYIYIWMGGCINHSMIVIVSYSCELHGPLWGPAPSCDASPSHIHVRSSNSY